MDDDGFEIVRQRWNDIYEGCWNSLTISGDDEKREAAKRQWLEGYAERIKAFATSLDDAGLRNRVDFMRSMVPEDTNEWIAWSLIWAAQHFGAEKAVEFMLLMQKDGQFTRAWWRIFNEYELDSEFFDQKIAPWRLVCPRCREERTEENVRHDETCERCSTRFGKFTLVLAVLRFFDRYGEERGRNFEDLSEPHVRETLAAAENIFRRVFADRPTWRATFDTTDEAVVALVHEKTGLTKEQIHDLPILRAKAIFESWEKPFSHSGSPSGNKVNRKVRKPRKHAALLEFAKQFEATGEPDKEIIAKWVLKHPNSDATVDTLKQARRRSQTQPNP